jgi:hypothetical protein
MIQLVFVSQKQTVQTYCLKMTSHEIIHSSNIIKIAPLATPHALYGAFPLDCVRIQLALATPARQIPQRDR